MVEDSGGYWSKLASRSSYFALNVTGSALRTAVSMGEIVASTVEPIALPIYNNIPIPDIREYLKPEPKQQQVITGVQNAKYLYEVRNRVLEIASKGILSIPYSSQLLDPVFKGRLKDAFIGAPEDDLRGFHVYSSGAQSEPLVFSFGSSNWLFFYQLGVAQCLKERVNRRVLLDTRFVGSGTGSIVAAILGLDLDIEILKVRLIEAVTGISKNLFGPISKLSAMWTQILHDAIPDDIDMARLDRLYVSISKVPNFESVVENKFESKEVFIHN